MKNILLKLIFPFCVLTIICISENTAFSQSRINNPVIPGVADAGVMKFNGRYYIGGVRTLGDFYVSDDLVNCAAPVHVFSMDNEWATKFGIGN